MMHRFFIFKNFDEKSFKPDDKLERQIVKVLRVKKNEQFLVINDNKEYLANYENGKIIVDKFVRKYETNDKPKIFIIQSLFNHSNQKIVLQKVTELGVSGIYFFESRYSNYKIENEKKKYDRYSSILKEASEQSNRLDIPQLNYLNNLNELSFSDDDLLLVAYEKENINTLANLNKDYKLKNYKRIFVLVGPEGGLEKEEIEKIKDMGFISLKLTNTILRTETAAIYFISILSFLII